MTADDPVAPDELAPDGLEVDGLTPPYDAVLFDNDGILIELTDEALLRDAARDALRESGLEPEPALVEALIDVRHLPADRLRAGGAEPAPVWRRREAAAIERQREAIRHGEKPLYDEVIDGGPFDAIDATLGIVSNNQHDTVRFILEHHDLAEHFDVAIGREPTLAGLRRKKPVPYYLERALAILGTRDALYVGDSEKDVVAARRAGIDVAFVRRPHRSDLSLGTEPTVEVPDLTSLVRALGAASASD